MHIEAIEPRRLLSGSSPMVELDGTTLVVRGAGNTSNVINVTLDVATNKLNVTVTNDEEGKEPVTLTESVDATGVTMVKVRGGKYADTITLGSAESPFAINSRIKGDKGNDTITTGSGNDRVDAGHGYDSVSSGAGDDQVWGGKGNDMLVGGDGNDRLYGGTGSDTLDGGAGDDLFHTIVGSDSVVGGSGADTFIMKKPKVGQGHVKDVGKHDRIKHVTKIGSDTDEAAPTA